MPLFRGDLLGALPNISLKIKERAMSQIMTGLKYIHGEGLVDCDIKRNNIFIKEATPLNIVIRDLGLATTMNDLRSGCGTRHYIAPEYFLVYFSSALTPAINIYALGRTFHVMLDYKRIAKEGFKLRNSDYLPPHYPHLV